VARRRGAVEPCDATVTHGSLGEGGTCRRLTGACTEQAYRPDLVAHDGQATTGDRPVGAPLLYPAQLLLVRRAHVHGARASRSRSVGRSSRKRKAVAPDGFTAKVHAMTGQTDDD
jgi:hypothetical protein